jgi:hypothetical protein
LYRFVLRVLTSKKKQGASGRVRLVEYAAFDGSLKL